MAHHGVHHTATLPRSLAGVARRAHRFEQRCARHWPFAAYTVLTLATAGYVIAQLITI